MRKLYYILFLSVIFWNCDDNVGYPFLGKDAVYFQLETEDFYWTRTLDSMVYSFAGKGVDEDTLWVRVNLEGNTSSEFRPFIIVVDEAETTAEVNLHYEALKSEYDLPKDSVYVYVPIIVYNKDRKLDNESVIITLKLQPTEALALGVTDRLSCRLIVSNQLNKPDYWEGLIASDFGTYSRKKHEVCLEVLGMDFPLTREEYAADRSAWRVYGAYMSNYFEEHYPIRDEYNNDAVIEPW